MMDDKKVEALIDEQMDDMTELVKLGARMQARTRAEATQALALLGIWDELRRHRPVTIMQDRLPYTPAGSVPKHFPPFKRGVGFFRPGRPSCEDFKPGLTD